MGKSTLLFMKRVEFFEHEVRGRKVLNKMDVRGQNVRLNEATKSAVISLPNVVCFRSGRWSGAR